MNPRALTYFLLPLFFLLGIQGEGSPQQGYDAIGQIETITLRVSPVFGALDELEDIVITLQMDSRIIAAQQVRQHDGVVTDRENLIATKDALAALADMLAQSGFYSLPDYIETDVLDGHMTSITVRDKDGQTFTSSGLVAETNGPAAFGAVYAAIGKVCMGATPLEGMTLAQMLTEEGAALLENAAQNPPAEVMVCYDTVAGGLPYTTDDSDVIRAVVDALQGMVVYENDGWGHTDDELWYALKWADGSGFSVSFQGGMLMDSRMNLYPVDGFGALYFALPPVVQ